MRGSYSLIIYEPAEIIHVLPPKCASTTMIMAFMNIADIKIGSYGIRKEKEKARANGMLAAKGLRIERCNRETLLGFRKSYPTFRMMANIRCPYERIASNYYNKLNRFTLQFAQKVYYYGKFRQFLSGPRAWGDVESGNHYMRKQLSFEEMLRGLEDHGTSFDVHYAPQSELLHMEQISFDRLIRLEHLQTELLSAMEACGIEPEALRRIQSLPRCNASNYDDKGIKALMTPTARKLISRLYEGDFKKLSYPDDPYSLPPHVKDRTIIL
jgi:hypothetical protein